MCIANELTCDVTAALLNSETDPDRDDAASLAEVALAFHTALRQLSSAAREYRRAHLKSTSTQTNSATASGR